MDFKMTLVISLGPYIRVGDLGFRVMSKEGGESEKWFRKWALLGFRQGFRDLG